MYHECCDILPTSLFCLEGGKTCLKFLKMVQTLEILQIEQHLFPFFKHACLRRDREIRFTSACVHACVCVSPTALFLLLCFSSSSSPPSAHYSSSFISLPYWYLCLSFLIWSDNKQLAMTKSKEKTWKAAVVRMVELCSFQIWSSETSYILDDNHFDTKFTYPRLYFKQFFILR